MVNRSFGADWLFAVAHSVCVGAGADAKLHFGRKRKDRLVNETELISFSVLKTTRKQATDQPSVCWKDPNFSFRKQIACFGRRWKEQNEDVYFQASMGFMVTGKRRKFFDLIDLKKDKTKNLFLERPKEFKMRWKGVQENRK